MDLILDARKLGDYGIGTYMQEIFTGIINSGEFTCRSLYLEAKGKLPLPEAMQIRCRSANYDLTEQFEIPWKLRHLRTVPYFSPHYAFPLALRNPLIVTIHDLIHFKFPQFFSPRIKVKAAESFIKSARKRARLVLTVSHQTQQDLCDLFDFTPEQVAVVPNGISDIFFTRERHETPSERPYLLFIGNDKPHKNLTLLLEVFADFIREYDEIDLVLAGCAPGGPVTEQITRLGLGKRVKVTGYLSQNELIDLIDACLFFVFPSHYEGFGLPPLEAMSRGKAVLSSHGGSLNEVLGPAAFYIDPMDHHSMLLGMRQLAGDSNLRDRLERLGEDRSRQFTWPKAVKATIDLIKERF
jgi:glycosyltransferase involved in cell wall biosynthesis